MARFEIERIPVLQDNYVWLVHEPAANVTGVVDPAVADPVLAAAKRRGWRITHILNTHHHPDHTGGNLEIKRATGCTIVGPSHDRDRIPGIDVEVSDGDSYSFGTERGQVFFVPGHTRGHIAYWFPGSDALFCGDTLFIMGCGRLFEGTPEQMWKSLSRLRGLPETARVYCAHEYTQSNARFALTVDPANADLKARATEVDRLRAEGQATVPGTLGDERKTNPFLRADTPGVAAAVGLAGAEPVKVFAEVRRRKDVFR
jgi:hydroxyacylglutathione hydrolase